MAARLLSDELWQLVEPLLPVPKRSPKGGRPPVGNRQALTGILFVLKTGIPWGELPQGMGCGCGMTCWCRLRDWQWAGVWKQLPRILLAGLRVAGRINWSRALVNSATVKAPLGRQKPGRIPRTTASAAASIT